MTVSGFDTPNDSYTFTGQLNERLASQTMADALDPPGVFPVAHNAFIGRTEAMRILQATLETPGELVVVTGPPGVGKSRLASECVYAHREIWSGGAWRCRWRRTPGRAMAATRCRGGASARGGDSRPPGGGYGERGSL